MHANAKAKKILIVGDGLEAWFTAATLSHILNMDDYSITVVKHPAAEHSSIDSLDSTQPDPMPLHHSVRLPEDYLVAQYNASFTFGIALSAWNHNDTAYFHPYSSIGAKLDTVAFHHLAMRLRDEGISVRLGNFTLGALAAQSNRLQRPVPNDRSVLSSCEWGLHIDTNALALLKRKESETLGVQFIDATVDETSKHDDETISHLILNNGEQISADLYIDCTGQTAIVASSWDENRWQSWQQWLPCQQKVSVQIPVSNPPAPYSLAQAHGAGWTRYVSTQDQMLVSHYYASDFMSEAQAIEQLSKSSNSSTADNFIHQELNSGRRKFAWYKNCIAIGSSAVQLDPIGISNLQLLRSALSKLAGLFPRNLRSQAVASEYNRRTALEFENARDFATLHYKLSGQNGHAFWDKCRKMTLPAILDYKLKLYQARGQIALYDEEPLQEQSWINLYDEHQVKVRSYNPLVYGFESANIKQHLQRIREIMLDAVSKMPTHAAYLAATKNNVNPK